MTLYEIDNEIMSCIDEETGEILDVAKLDELQMARDKKIENVLCWIKNLESDAEAIKTEKNALAVREKSARTKAENLRSYVSAALNGQKFQSPRVSASWRRSEGVIVNTMDGLYVFGGKYVTYKEPEPNKTTIKAALKAGEIVPGCYLEERQNLTIK